jgi:uncharacterized protein (DUF1778 family)
VADEDRRDKSMRVLVTGAEQDEVQRAASGAGMSTSTWVRTLALQHAREVTQQARAIARRQTKTRRAS